MNEETPNYIPVHRDAGWISVPDLFNVILESAKEADTSGKAALMELLIYIDANTTHASKRITISEEMLLFLKGAGELDGYNFGERGEEHGGAFWWRKHLPK